MKRARSDDDPEWVPARYDSDSSDPPPTRYNEDISNSSDCEVIDLSGRPAKIVEIEGVIDLTSEGNDDVSSYAIPTRRSEVSSEDEPLPRRPWRRNEHTNRISGDEPSFEEEEEETPVILASHFNTDVAPSPLPPQPLLPGAAKTQSDSTSTSTSTKSTSTNTGRTVTISTVSIVPGKEFRRTVQWGVRSPFYRLGGEFRDPVVFIFQGKVLKPYMVPERISSSTGTTGLEILILTKTQYQEIELSDDPAERFAAALRDDHAAEVEPEASAEFPIRLVGSRGDTRVMVTPHTQCRQLVEHYMKVTNSPTARIKFEGDIMDNSTTVEEMELEDGDMVDVV